MDEFTTVRIDGDLADEAANVARGSGISVDTLVLEALKTRVEQLQGHHRVDGNTCASLPTREGSTEPPRRLLPLLLSQVPQEFLVGALPDLIGSARSTAVIVSS